MYLLKLILPILVLLSLALPSRTQRPRPAAPQSQCPQPSQPGCPALTISNCAIDSGSGSGFMGGLGLTDFTNLVCSGRGRGHRFLRCLACECGELVSGIHLLQILGPNICGQAVATILSSPAGVPDSGTLTKDVPPSNNGLVERDWILQEAFKNGGDGYASA
ncbi:hypothetical protein DFS34DRAFT_685620 [Phlyctochytrium arcticum]|nr:hypothetical protein DFS34DRAFT_685620 [Phlyctochytrium arcticum]